MHYEGMIYRPPSEGGSLIIQATVGCPHNRCRFCNMYKDKRFRIRKVAEILEDIDEAGRLYGKDNVRTVFLADGNTAVMRTGHLLRILERLNEVFPRLERITSYCASQYMDKKTEEEWADLRSAGLSRIHCGMESGHDPLLSKVCKGTSMEEQIRGGRAVRAAGIELSMYYLAGLGGAEMSGSHAADSAAVLNAVNPEFIRVRTFTPMPGTELGEDCRSGRFIPLDAHATLRELRLLIERLEGDGLFLSDHWLNFADIRGRLPKDKERMLKAVDEALALPDDFFRPVGMITDSL
ncbi:MAG: radical SAM protein [Desulfovibrio sp.]|nr:radical SAM protein [Desulfovibrio sp.]